jgi:hypothetical protein
MDQQMIIEDLVLKGLWARAIHQDPITTVGCNAVACSSFSRSFRERGDHPPCQNTAPAGIRRGVDHFDRVLLFALDENAFTSVRQLSPPTGTGRPTVRDHSPT